MGLVYTWFDHTQGKRPLEIVFSSRIRVKWNTGRRGIEQTELEMTVNRREIQYFYGPNIESVTALTGEDAAEKTRICQRVFEAFWYAEKIQPAGTGLIWMEKNELYVVSADPLVQTVVFEKERRAFEKGYWKSQKDQIRIHLISLRETSLSSLKFLIYPFYFTNTNSIFALMEPEQHKSIWRRSA